MQQEPMLRGDEVLAKRKDFKLVGRNDELKLLCSILMRRSANSIMLVGPGGVGSSSLCVGLEACKTDPNTPFDIVSKRNFWLDSDRLFSSGESETINANFNKMMGVLYRTPDSVLFVEDTRDFIEACRNHGTMHFINALTLAVKNGKTQVVFEVHDDDLDTVMKCHSDMREGYTLIDLEEPTGAALTEIVTNVAAGLGEFHRIKIAPEAIHTAIELTNKYRTRDAGLSRAQPERSITLLDRALASYRLTAHQKSPKMAALETALRSAADADKDRISAELDAAKAEWVTTQALLRKHQQAQRDAEIELIKLETQLEDQIAEETRKREQLATNGGQTEEAKPASRIASFTGMAAQGGHESPEVQEIKRRIASYQTAVDENKKKFLEIADAIDSTLLLTRELVLREFSRISGISANRLDEDERVKLTRLEPTLKQRIFGQDDVVARVANGIKVAKLGRRTRGAPLSFLYLGPSGVGKTEIAKAIASALLDDETALTRFDMSEYMEKHAVAKLIGAPPGYEGFEVGGILTNAMRRNPNRVLLFDEIEKAHPDVFNIFLQILSDGRLTDNVGRTVAFADSIVLMTTNIGQPHFLNPELDFEQAKAAAMVELGQTYRSEFLNRFNGRQNILCFNRLNIESIQKIVHREIDGIDAIYREQGITTSISEADLALFCRDHYDPAIGARGLPGYLQSNLEPVLVNRLLENPDIRATLNVGYDQAKRQFTYGFTEQSNG